MANKPEYITDIRFFSTEKSGNGPEARGSFTLAGAVYINFVIWTGQDGGYQVQLPRTPNPKFDASQQASKTNKRHFEEVGCTSGPVREAITVYLVDQLIEERSASPVGNSGSYDSEGPIPF